MKWQEDLIRDIRFGNHFDDADYNDGSIPNTPRTDFSKCPTHPIHGYGITMTQCNIDALKSHFNKIINKCDVILEIGVDCNYDPTEMTSTRTFLDTKRESTHYFGVDLNDKSYLNNEEKNILTIKSDASDIENVMNVLRSYGKTQIDFLFIDGWHSINQVLREWEYTKYLSPHGIVGFHDTKMHPGPNLFVNNMDTTKWNVVPNSCENNDMDFGIGFAWRK